MKKLIPIIIIVAAITGVGIFFITNNNDTKGTVESATTSQTNPQKNNSATSNTPTTTPSSTTYSKSDVASHASRDDCWTIINGYVYDITSYVPIHPGGVSEITRICGKDGTSLFTSNPQHDSRATNELANLKIGTLN